MNLTTASLGRRSHLLLTAALALLTALAALWAWSRLSPLPAPLGIAQAEAAEEVTYWPAKARREEDRWTGRLQRLNSGLALLTVRGNAEERGTAHGKLLGAEIRALVKSVKRFLEPNVAPCLDGAKIMKKHLDDALKAELKACAKAAEVEADELLLAQLFGDVNRAKGFKSLCSSFCAFGPATQGGRPLVGRNFDYGGHGLEGGLPLVLQELHAEGKDERDFITIGYAGILNGWTAMNVDGLCASNNTLFGGEDSLEGLSTCFLLRKIVEHGKTVEDGVAIVEQTARACTTGMLVAGRNRKGDWDARFVEFDHRSTALVEPRNGVLLATNTRQKLTLKEEGPREEPACGRFQALKRYLGERAGTLNFEDPAQNPVAAPNVYMQMNLHCALLDPLAQRFRLAVSPGDGKPAAEQPFREFQVRADRVSESKKAGAATERR